ncbi:hypothetical protein Avbf_15517, partial [Armadillidium vulgare]
SCLHIHYYLLQIYKRVENGEKVFTVRKIEEEIKYGEVSISENKLFFHSLSLSEVPTNSSLIWFEELKQCAYGVKLPHFHRDLLQQEQLNSQNYY